MKLNQVRRLRRLRSSFRAFAELMLAAFSGDDRALDGAEGAEFLHEFKMLMEEPARMIL